MSLWIFCVFTLGFAFLNGYGKIGLSFLSSSICAGVLSHLGLEVLACLTFLYGFWALLEGEAVYLLGSRKDTVKSLSLKKRLAIVAPFLIGILALLFFDKYQNPSLVKINDLSVSRSVIYLCLIFGVVNVWLTLLASSLIIKRSV